MAEFWANIIKWFTELSPQKALVAALAGLCVYSLWTVYDNKGEFKELQLRYDKLNNERTADSKECRAKIDTLNARWQDKFDHYRNEREAELKKLADDNQKKMDIIQQKIWDLQFKAESVENKNK